MEKEPSGTLEPLTEPTFNLYKFHSRLSLFPRGFRDFGDTALSRFLYDYYDEVPWWRNFFGLDELVTIRHQWRQVVIAILIYTLSLYVDCLAQVYLQLNYVKSKTVLTDIGFRMLPYWDNAYVSDYVVAGFVITTMIRFLVVTGPLSMRWTILRRTILCMGTLFLLRGFSIICTVLPNPAKDCVSDVSEGENTNIALEAWYIILGWRVTCADVLYSGHTVHLTLCLLVWWNYAHLCPMAQCRMDMFPLGKTLASVWCVSAYILIIVTHVHYTVDVWLGFWMTYFVWNFYHEAIKSSPFFETRFFNFLTWMETESTDLYYWRLRVQQAYAMDQEIKDLMWRPGDWENSSIYAPVFPG